MLDALEDDLDTATTNLGLVTMKTKELIQKSGGKRNFILMVKNTRFFDIRPRDFDAENV